MANLNVQDLHLIEAARETAGERPGADPAELAAALGRAQYYIGELIALAERVAQP